MNIFSLLREHTQKILPKQYIRVLSLAAAVGVMFVAAPSAGAQSYNTQDGVLGHKQVTLSGVRPILLPPLEKPIETTAGEGSSDMPTVATEPTPEAVTATIDPAVVPEPMVEIQPLPEPAPVPEPEPAPFVPQSVDGSLYPYKNAAYPSGKTDPWGMFMRECVSYTAWKVAASGRHMPSWGGKGNAKLWDDNAIAAGIPVDATPRAHDIAVSNAGQYGHVMYVEAVNPNGTITVSQYNAQFDGKYSVSTRSSAGLVFIHFP